MYIDIHDDFDLKKIVYSGQCFRPVELEGDWYRFIHGSEVLYIKRDTPDATPCDPDCGFGTYEISCGEDTWNRVWRPYFNLDFNYSKVRQGIPNSDSFMKEASMHGAGIRILNQDPFEMIISFIISQRKNIPAIKASIDKLCGFYGKKIDTGKESLHLFPSPQEIMDKGFEKLSECSLGYRLPYIESTVEAVAGGDFDPISLRDLPDDELLEALMSLKGVGIKVASCVALFAYGRGAIAPVDTWIARVIDKYYGGSSPFPEYGNLGGIYQQYAFYYMTHGPESSE